MSKPKYWLVGAQAAMMGIAVIGGCAVGEEDDEQAVEAIGGNSLKQQVRTLAAAHGVTPIPPAPAVSDALYNLGQALAFDKILSGNKNISCMTCHHPTLGSDDNRSLALGEGGLGLGRDRVGGGVIPRNAQALFNLDTLGSMFWDQRVRPNGAGGFITPANSLLTPEMVATFDFGVVSAQAMFPVLSRDEMRGQRLTNAPNTNELAPEYNHAQIWALLMARLGAIPEYVTMFEAAYPGTPFANMTFAHAANAIAGFEIRGFAARNSPWERFLSGDDGALSTRELRGARDFFNEGCANCHSGPSFSDDLAHDTALAQFGSGKGHGPTMGHTNTVNDDFGRGGATNIFGIGSLSDKPEARYAFRTPPLTNVELTGPWGHDGQFTNLGRFVEHYKNPEDALRKYDMAKEIHSSEFFLLDMRLHNEEEVISHMDPLTQVNVPNTQDMVAFLDSLTDPASRHLDHLVPARVPSGLPVSDGVAPHIPGAADGSIAMVDLDTTCTTTGLESYHRAPSPRNAIAEQKQQQSLTTPMVFFDIFDTPLRPRGMPGIAVFDYDKDGDEDLFVSNGPGGGNALFTNQLSQTGQVRFVDRAAEAGVRALDTDNSGVCYGDIDNDGDDDMFVVADMGRSHFYLNNGNGTFADISATSGAVIDGIGGTSCAFGDINGDGLLDLAIARAWHQNDLHACFTDPFGAGIQPNELYVNQGGGHFADVSTTSGIRNLGGLPPWAAGAPTITWSISLVDYDADGDVDILTADDQCGLPNANLGGVSRGFLQIFNNDGTGNFTNKTVEAGTNHPSAWMGLSFGDFNSDGYLDFFSPSFGDWGKLFGGAPVILGDETSRWYLGGPGGTFTYPGVGDLQRMPFGWGTVARDFDNDGDTDLSFHGGMDLWFMIDRSNPGTMLLNDGDAHFGFDRSAFPSNHSRRNDSGVAAADLNHDGFTDIITVSDIDLPNDNPLHSYGADDNEVFFFSIFDQSAYYAPVFEAQRFPDPANKLEQLWKWNPERVFPDGTVRVEMNTANNKNRWASVRLAGAAGVTTRGTVNRDAIGAMLTFTPEGGKSVMAPVLGGSSHLSQDSLTQGFGLGKKKRGRLEILWPGGNRTRLDDVRHGESLVVPELGCSYTTTDARPVYKACVEGSLNELVQAGWISNSFSSRLRKSALDAYDDLH
ncbi:MAG: FG-GAP-like repeat-containing protein [Polyangiaceae bacterium]